MKQVCQEIKGVVAIDGKLMRVLANVMMNILPAKKALSSGWFQHGPQLTVFSGSGKSG